MKQHPEIRKSILIHRDPLFKKVSNNQERKKVSYDKNEPLVIEAVDYRDSVPI